jgi:pectin methylesterase-like acyl-CoA thioesterase
VSHSNSIIWASFFLYVAAMTPCHSQTREQTTVPARRTVHVGATADAEFRTIQQAIDSAADNGLNILIAPGVYKEKVAIVQANISLIGTGREPSDTVITWGDSAKNTGSTFKSGTVTVTSDGFTAENLTIRNTWWDDHPNPDDASQAVALQLSSDRAVVDRVRLISGQDTLFAASLTCRSNTSNAPCDASRQLFNDCFIEGNVDYIFGDAKAVFNHCELNSRQHPTVVITAQSKHFPEENSGYFILHCSITGTDDGNRVVLGRPWRDYSTVTFFDTDILEEIAAEGWSDWDGRLKTATYREYDSHGQGANEGRRDVVNPPLTPAERALLTPRGLLAGEDHWDPMAQVERLRQLVR